jgi:hypothetical protein
MSYTGLGEGQRVAAGSNSYQYDATGLSMAAIGGSTTDCTTLPDGSLLSETIGTSTYYYLSDGAGNVAGLTGPSASLANSYSYDPQGNFTTKSETVSNPFTYQGGMYDSSSGLYYMGQSGYYDPTVGMQTGCKDKGPYDTAASEDYCGEDEAPYDDSFATTCGSLYAYPRTNPYLPNEKSGSFCATAYYHPNGALTIRLTLTPPPQPNGRPGWITQTQGHLASHYGGVCSLNTNYNPNGVNSITFSNCTLLGQLVNGKGTCVSIYAEITIGALGIPPTGRIGDIYGALALYQGALCFPH